MKKFFYCIFLHNYHETSIIYFFIITSAANMKNADGRRQLKNTPQTEGSYSVTAKTIINKPACCSVVRLLIRVD